MGCDDDIVKCLMFWANFCLALVGVTVLSLGIIYKISLEEFAYAIPKDYQNIILIPILIIPLGSIMIAIAVFGCYGCITERSTFLTIYGGILLLVFSIQVAAGLFAFFQIKDRYNFDRQLNGTLDNTFKNYEESLQYENKNVVDLIQHRLKCCGINGSTYWIVIPKSCYETDTINVYKEACPPLVSKYLIQSIQIVGISMLALSITEIAGAIISLSFANSLKNVLPSFGYVGSYPLDNNGILSQSK